MAKTILEVRCNDVIMQPGVDYVTTSSDGIIFTSHMPTGRITINRIEVPEAGDSVWVKTS